MRASQILKAATIEVIGAANFDEVIYAKALAKAKRWAKQAYGSADLTQYLGENGPQGIVAYYEETVEIKDGIATANRQSEISTRRDRNAI